MTKKEKNKKSLEKKSLRTEKVVPNSVYLKNFAEVTVLTWKVPGYAELDCNVMYNKIFESAEFRSIFKLLKTSDSLNLCVCSDKLSRKVAEFLLVDEAENTSLRCLAMEMAEGCYKGEFLNESFLCPASSYLRNNVLIVSFKCFSYQNLKYSQDILSEVTEPLADVDELCCDLRESFFEGLYSDFLIHISDYTFKAHKFVLAAHSEFFDDFFQNNQGVEEYRMSDDVPPSIMHEIILYMYSGELKESCLEYMFTVSRLALQFKIDTLAHKCGRYFEKCIEEANRSQIPDAATSYPVVSGRQKISIDCMKMVCRAAYNRKISILANKYARFLERRLDKFLYLPTCPPAKEYDKVNLDCVVSLWKLSYKRKLITLQKKCTRILERCIDDSLWFDTLVMTGQTMELNMQWVINISEFARNMRLNVLSSKCVRYLDKHIDVDSLTELPAGIVADEKEINVQCMGRIFLIAWKTKFDPLVNRCIRYFLRFMNNYDSSGTPVLLKDLECLVKAFQVKNKLETSEDTFYDTCISFFIKCLENYSEMPIEAESPIIVIIDCIEKLYEISGNLNVPSLKSSCMNFFWKCISDCCRFTLTRKTINQNIDCVRRIFRLAHKFKLMELKVECVICLEKLIRNCDDLSVGVMFPSTALKTISNLCKLAHKLKIRELKTKCIDVLDRQIRRYAIYAVNITRLEEEWEPVITLWNVARKLKIKFRTIRCVITLEKRIEKLNRYIQEKYRNTPEATELKVFNIESVVKVCKLGCRLMRAVHYDQQMHEFKRKQQSNKGTIKQGNQAPNAQEIEQSIQEESTIRNLLFQCDVYFDYILSKAGVLDFPSSEKLKVINCIVDICDLTRRYFLHSVSQNLTRCRNLELRYKCLEFLAMRTPDECYKNITEPSTELNVEFMVKLFELACELNTDIEGEIRAYNMFKESDRTTEGNRQAGHTDVQPREPNSMEKAHAAKLKNFCYEFFVKVREIDIFDVPAETQKRNVDSFMKMIESARKMNETKLQNELSGFLVNYILPETKKTTAAESKGEMLDLENVLKICEFAYTIEKESLKNDCVLFIQKLLNENNWREIYALGARIDSKALKNAVDYYVATIGKIEELKELKKEVFKQLSTLSVRTQKPKPNVKG